MRKFFLSLALCLTTVFALSDDDIYIGEIATWSGFRKGAVSFTFDKGAPEQIDGILPLLHKYDFKGTFYVTEETVYNWNVFQALADEGHEIGSRPNTSGGEVSSKQAINNKIKQPYGCITIAYPNCLMSDRNASESNYIAGRVCNSEVMGKDGPTDWAKVPAIITGSEGVNTSYALIGKMNDVMTTNGWVVFLTHGIQGTSMDYSPTNSGALNEALAWARQNDQRLWVAPFRDVVMYCKERQASSFTVKSHDNVSVTYGLTHTIANDICEYNYPLSLRVPLPAGWTSPQVRQAGNILSFTIDKNYVYFEAIPNNGDICLYNYSVYTEYDGDATLTYYYDTQMDTRKGITERYDPDVPRFKTYHNNIKTVVIDKSMKEAPLAKSSYMFYGGEEYDDDAGYKYYGLYELTKIDGLENLNTAQMTDMSSMFVLCGKVKSLDLSSFNTENVTDMSFMFAYSQSLESVNLMSFNIDKVENMREMFNGCSDLKTIYCDGDWSKSTALKWDDNMFRDCDNLVGEKGTTYEYNYCDKTYARPDGVGGKSGYFTASVPQPKKVYTYYDGDATLTYYYNDAYASLKGGVVEFYDPANMFAVRFDGYADKVITAKIDPSMKDAQLTSTSLMFCGVGLNSFLTKLTTIEGLENLNTDNVTSMSSMFWLCSSLTSLDLSNFNTENVTDMSSVFDGCEKLESLDLGNFNTGKVTNMASMFGDCKSLTSLDIRMFNLENVREVGSMFYGCSELTTIYCNADLNELTVYTADLGVFTGCVKLKGGQGTSYDAGHVERAYARPDGLNGQPGYFTGDTYHVTLQAEHGTVTVNETVDLDKVVVGSKLTFTAIPDEGYTFTSWENYDEATGLIVTSDVTVKALFEKQEANALDDTDSAIPSARKHLRNGILYINRNGNTYTAQGQRID